MPINEYFNKITKNSEQNIVLSTLQTKQLNNLYGIRSYSLYNYCRNQNYREIIWLIVINIIRPIKPFQT